MLPIGESNPFGSRSRTRILLALSDLGSSYPRALARRLDSPIFAVRKALEALERDGLVTSHLVGRTRVYTFDSSYVAHKELAAYLARLVRARTDAARAKEQGGPPPAGPGVEAGGEGRKGTAPPGPGGGRPDPDEGWRNW